MANKNKTHLAFAYLACASFVFAANTKPSSPLDGLESLDEPKTIEAPKLEPENKPIEENAKEPELIAVENYRSLTAHLTSLRDSTKTKQEEATNSEVNSVNASLPYSSSKSTSFVVDTSSGAEAVKDSPEIQNSANKSIEVTKTQQIEGGKPVEAEAITLVAPTDTPKITELTQEPTNSPAILSTENSGPTQVENPLLPDATKFVTPQLVAAETTVSFKSNSLAIPIEPKKDAGKVIKKTKKVRWTQSDLPKGAIYPNNKGVIVIGVVALPLERAENPFDLRYVAPGSSTESTILYSGAILNSQTGQPIAFVNGHPAIKGEKVNGAFNLATIRRDEIVLERNGDNYVIALNQPIIMRLTN